MTNEGRDASRVVRLTQIQSFLSKNPRGLTTKELARMCNVTVRTIQRDLTILGTEMEIPIECKGHDRWGVIKDHTVTPAVFSLNETVVIFLALRLMIRQTDEGNPYNRSAISKLISMMPKPLAAQLNRSNARAGKKAVNRSEMKIFELIAKAWVGQKKTRITYNSFHRKEREEWVVDPYFLEMTGTGSSTYVIGYGEKGEQKLIYPFKLNRIEKVEILDESFRMPDDLDLDKILESSWGIVLGEGIEIKLKFSEAVTRRVKETVWHPSQKIEDLAEGGCLLKMKVNSLIEISPWLRGWGPDLEVLEPPELRQMMKGWAEELHNIYYTKSV